jgi:hypothetical protein
MTTFSFLHPINYDYCDNMNLIDILDLLEICCCRRDGLNVNVYRLLM